MKRFFSLNVVFGLYLIVFVALLMGSIPRSSILVVTILLGLWMYLRPLEEGTLFFVRAIPLFIALPLTPGFDNMNMWRPLSLILLIRLLLEPSTWSALRESAEYFIRKPSFWLQEHPVARRLTILLLLAALSLIGAQYPGIGMKRIIYFINLSCVPVVIWTLLRQRRLSVNTVIRAISVSTIVVIVAGFLQLLTTYLMDIYAFMRLWGEQIQLRQFGTQWSYIAVWRGNTWLAYYGSQLSLRMFSLFPDSHSFPTFLLLGLPALFAVSIDSILLIAGTSKLIQLTRTYAQMSILWVPAAFLAAILSGTRGIWAASVCIAVLVPCIQWLLRRTEISIVRRRIFSYMAAYLLAFFLLFGVAWPIFISPQFLVGKGDFGLMKNRIRSVIDFGETSNALRIAIWKASLTSIEHHPLLGVGIGNFPVVLGQQIELSRAGSTAHNLYLHIASEMGIPAAVEAIFVLLFSVVSAWKWFVRADGRSVVYAGALLLYLPWVYVYVLTDPILFDERVFMMFATTLALVWAQEHA